MKFVRQIFSVINFFSLPREQRKLVFYSEGQNYWPHLEGLVGACLDLADIHVIYLSSDTSDPGLCFVHERFHSFEIGEGTIRTWLFENIDTDVIVMTMPDLETFHIKRSRYPVHYVYVQHSLVSLHMVYRSGAFDHYDTIFCSGSHHVQETRALEQFANLPAKLIVKHGYARVSSIIEEAFATIQPCKKVPNPVHVLIAPSWGPDGTIERCGIQLVDVLLQAGFEVTLRPHPNTVKLAGVVLEKIHRKHGKNSNFHFESNVAGCDALLRSQVMVSDWSGAALEYAFGLGKPVVFIDVPRKVNNPDYATLELEPIEVSIREKIGVVVDPEQLDTLPKVLFDVIETGLDHSDFFNLRDKLVFNIGKQDEVGARYLIGLLD